MADAEAIAATVPAKTKKPESLEYNPSEGKPACILLLQYSKVSFSVIVCCDRLVIMI